VPPVSKPEGERFLARVALSDTGCWLWTGAIASSRLPYGRMPMGRRGEWVLAHRYSHEIFNGPIPEGYDVDHLCRNPSCVNPNHLEAVTHRENLLRGVGWAGLNARKQKCANGHEFTAENTIFRGAFRRCRICVAAEKRRWRDGLTPEHRELLNARRRKTIGVHS
jgi:hypothetical protein